jgi:predicted HNH restriction endonuclease
MRSAGGKHTEDNLILVCQPCHHFIHHNPELSYERGWLRRRQAAI